MASGGASPSPARVRRKKATGGHGHHGGAWKVAYADFVTAMMALFMVMWLLASTDQQSRKQIANYFRSGVLEDAEMAMTGGAQHKPPILEQSPVPPRNPGMEKQAAQIRGALERMAHEDERLADVIAQVSVTVTDDGVLIEAVEREGGASMLFDVSSSKLKPGLVEFLEKVGPVLAEGQAPVRVIGHTDARPFADRAGKSNWDLSYERADAARGVLERSGLAGRIAGVEAHADAELRNSANPFAAENRRLGILVVHKPPMPPGSPGPPGPPGP
jgi:chemotaxis protein MotB